MFEFFLLQGKIGNLDPQSLVNRSFVEKYWKSPLLSNLTRRNNGQICSSVFSDYTLVTVGT